MADLQRETTEVLQQLVRFNTVNPPGNERAAIEYLERVPGRGRVRDRAARRRQERPNLVATLSGAARVRR